MLAARHGGSPQRWSEGAAKPPRFRPWQQVSRPRRPVGGQQDARLPVLNIRLADEGDAGQIFAFDQIAQEDAGRREYIHRAVESAACYVAVDNDQVKAYAVLRYSFFEQGFVELLYVGSNDRRQGVGKRLMQHVESVCLTDKLFTSTNLSNHPMQALLARLGYRLSGLVNDLDPGDPELIYVKYLRGSAQFTRSAG